MSQAAEQRTAASARGPPPLELKSTAEKVKDSMKITSKQPVLRGSLSLVCLRVKMELADCMDGRGAAVFRGGIGFSGSIVCVRQCVCVVVVYACVCV